mmetsp:Transcript_8370/g.26735  ORF Transcript_8370/g.26735 Transcript_8370/m.26735 type:complete len:361 (-) Transcript_8370:27-1109(-)
MLARARVSGIHRHVLDARLLDPRLELPRVLRPPVVPPPQLVRRCADRRTGSAQVVEREEEPQARQPRCCQGYAWRRLDRAEVEMRHAATAVIATAAAAAAAAPTAAAARQDSARPAERRDGDGSSCGERRRQPWRRLRETAVDEGRPAGARGGGSSPRLAAVPLALRRQRDACCFGVGWRRAEEVEGVRRRRYRAGGDEAAGELLVGGEPREESRPAARALGRADEDAPAEPLRRRARLVSWLAAAANVGERTCRDAERVEYTLHRPSADRVLLRECEQPLTRKHRDGHCSDRTAAGPGKARDASRNWPAVPEQPSRHAEVVGEQRTAAREAEREVKAHAEHAAGGCSQAANRAHRAERV